MKYLFSFLFALLFSVSSFAEPAWPGLWRTVKLQNGKLIKVELKGDEHMHYWQSEDGTKYVLNSNNIAEKADMDLLIANARRSLSLAGTRVSPFDEATCRRTRSLKSARKAGRFEGKKKGLIILAQFSDKSFSLSNPQEYYNRMANEPGFSDGGSYGSVHDYFHDQSDGKFNLEYDVVGPVTLGSYATYGGNDANGHDANPALMIQLACQKANESFPGKLHWADYDWDGDGKVEQVFVIYAGRGEASGGDPDTVWPHKSTLKRQGSNDMTLHFDGKEVAVYACSNEMLTETTLAGIGTICHEFSHCLGFPDLYDIDYEDNGRNPGAGGWDLMDNGNHNKNGFCPAGYSSYEKITAGWLEPIELSATQKIENLKPLSQKGEAYVVLNKAHDLEFFLLENRQPIKWDSGLPGRGLLIWHMDFDAYIWANNKPNTTGPYWTNSGTKNNDHQRLVPIPAGGSISNYRTMAFPQGSANSLTNNTNYPGQDLYNPNSDGTHKMNVLIQNITQNDDQTVSFSFGLYESGSVGNNVAFYESFNKCSGKGGNDGAWNGLINQMGTTAHFHPDVEGWSSTKTGGASQCGLFASEVTSPEIDLSGDYDFSFVSGPFGNQDATLSIEILGNASVNPTSFNIAANKFNECKAKVKASGKFKIKFKSSSSYLFLDEVKIAKKVDDGIKAINDANVGRQSYNNRIYSLNGVFMGTDITKLPHGVYIVNGKKFVK